jgi:hypothetical protein
VDGTTMYVADVATRHLLDAAPLVNGQGTAVYLAADTGGGCMIDALGHMRSAGDDGTIVYLANSEPINIKGAAKTASGVAPQDIGDSIYSVRKHRGSEET